MARKYIKGDVQPFGSGKAAFRFLLPREVAMADQATAHLAMRDGALMMWFGPEKRVVMYPCNDNSLLNFVCIHPDTESHEYVSSCDAADRPAATSRDWNTRGSTVQLLKVFSAFDPALLSLMSKADPDTLRVWRLMDMAKLPTWCAGRMALLGDAAHPFTPRRFISLSPFP